MKVLIKGRRPRFEDLAPRVDLIEALVPQPPVRPTVRMTVADQLYAYPLPKRRRRASLVR